MSATRKAAVTVCPTKSVLATEPAIAQNLTTEYVIDQTYYSFSGYISKTIMPITERRPIALAASCLACVVLAGAACKSADHGAGVALGTVAAIGVAAFASALAGFAFSAICGAFLFQFRHDTVAVVQIMLICSIANQMLGVWSLRHDIRLKVLIPFLAGGVVGVPTGVWLLLHVNVALYIKGVGVILLFYGLYMLFRRPVLLRRSPVAGDVVSGFLGGLTGGFAATPGFPVSVWCSMKGWDKVRQRAVFQPFILLLQFVAMGCIAVMAPRHAAGIGVPPIVWACVPAGLIGTAWGLAWFQQMTDRQFASAINMLLVISGAILLV